jgi:anti-anti-sigma regulatory factor
MLRITTLTAKDQVTLKLEGKLSGPWVGEVAKVWERVRPDMGRRPITVDLHAVSFVDERGKGVLAAMRQGGAELVATGPLMTALLEEIAHIAS